MTASDVVVVAGLLAGVVAFVWLMERLRDDE